MDRFAGGVACALLAAARDVAVSKVVLLSSITVRDHGERACALSAQHKTAEDAVEAAGIDWTILRCGGFAAKPWPGQAASGPAR